MNLVDGRHPDYQSYMVRLWRTDARHVWHGSLQCTATEQVYHFPTIEELIAFLTAQLTNTNDPCAEQRELE